MGNAQLDGTSVIQKAGSRIDIHDDKYDLCFLCKRRLIYSIDAIPERGRTRKRSVWLGMISSVAITLLGDGRVAALNIET